MHLTLSDDVALASLLVAFVSLVVAVWSVVVGKRSLQQAQESVTVAQDSLRQAQDVAELDRRDWEQRKWFDLYVKTSDVYDLLNKFQAVYGGPDRVHADS